MWAFVMALFSFFFSVTIIMCAFVIALFSLFSVTTINTFVLDRLHLVITWFSFFSVTTINNFVLDHLHPVVMALFRFLFGPVKNFLLNHLYLFVMALFPFLFTFFSFQIKNFLWDHRYVLLVGSNVKALTREFDILTKKLKDVQKEIEKDEASMKKKPTEEVEGWMKRVEALQSSVESVETAYANRSYLRNICSISIQAVNELKEVRQEVEFIKSIRAYTTAAPLPPVQSMSTTPIEFGREMFEAKLQEALNFLRDDNQGVLGIWGMGGVGKTTLLEHINNTLKTNPSSYGLDKVVFVTVSRDCTIEKIQKQIVKKLGLHQGADQTDVFNYLSNKSFAILLDDVWERQALKEVGVPLPLGAFGEHKLKRKLILTTRSRHVCSKMGARQPIKVECLGTEDARLLFRDNAGIDATMISYNPLIGELADKVADECDGLPIALITTGQAMAGTVTLQVWENALELLRTSKMSQIPGMDDPLPLLKVSYDYLKDEGKQQCLLHCALWPEDHKIRKDELIQCWMGHGLLGEFNNLQEAYRKGHVTIESLQKASLLERVESGDLDVKDDYVKLHDLIRDMALWIACDCGANKNKWIVLARQDLQEAPRDKNLWREAHKISLMYNKIKSLPSEIRNNSSNLTTLMIRSNKFDAGGLRMSKCFNSLKYLDISSCSLKCFPTEICGLTTLEYLNISNTCISSLPEELKALVNLKFLIARFLPLNSRVPPELLSNLVNLIELDLFESGNEDFVSSVIDNLGCLEGRLKGLGIRVRTVSDLQKLVQLSGIPIRSLYLKGMEGLSSSLELLSHDFLGSQHIRSNLKELILDDCDSVAEVVVEGRHELKNIEVLYLYNARRLNEIKWKRVEPRDVLPKLRHVCIRSCDALKSVEWVMYLPCLELLTLQNCKEMEQMFGEEARAAGTKQEEEDKATFPSLRGLWLLSMPKLRSICNRLLTFPSLEDLRISNCRQLKKLPFHSPSSCTKLRKIKCNKATWEGLDLEDNMQATLEPLLEIW